MTISQTITAPALDPPTAPSRDDPANFRTEADAFVDWLGNDLPTEIDDFSTEVNTWASEANSLATTVNGYKTDAEAAQTAAEAAQAEAEDAEAVALAAANYVGEWGDQTGAATVPTSVSHNDVFYLLTEDIADITAETPGVSAKWQAMLANEIFIETGGGIKDENGNEQLLFSTTASAVNEITFKNAATGNGPQVQATGDDANIDISLVPKGTGVIQISANLDTNGNDITIDDTHGVVDENGNEQLSFSTTASAVNEVTIKNAATGNGPQIQATGGDSNIDLLLVPKGTGAVNLADNILLRPLIKDYGEEVNAIGSIGGGTQDIDLEAGNVVTATVDTSETTFTFSNALANDASSFTLILTNGGSQTVNWPATVRWEGGVAPSLTSSGVDILVFFSVKPSTDWYGFRAGEDMS
jgi:hypothetical protein